MNVNEVKGCSVKELENDITDCQKSELNFRECERGYRLAVEYVTDVIWTVNTNAPTQLNYISPSVTHLLGYTVEEAIMKPMEEVFTAESLRKAWNALAEEMAREQIEPSVQHRGKTVELELNHKNGSIVPVEANFTLIRGDNGRPVEIVCVARDITRRRQYEKKLKESEEFNRILLEYAPNPIIVQNLDTSIKYVNPAWEKLTGYSSSEVIGEKVPYRHWPEEDINKNLQEMQDALGQCVNKLVKLFKKKNGEKFWVEVTPALVKDTEGKIKYQIANWIDITERKKTEDALVRSEAKFRSLAEQSPNMIFINKDGRVIYANKKCEEVTGYKREEFYASDFNFLTLISPEYRDLMISNFGKHKQGCEVAPTEMTLLTKEKKRIEVLHSTKVVEYDGEKALLGIDVDVTLQKQTEEKLRLAAQEWRTTFDSITDMIFLQDREGKIMRMNKAFANRFHKRPQDLIGSSCCKIVHGTDTPPVDCPFQKVLVTKKPASIEFFEPSLGIYIQGSSSPILDEKGNISGSVNILRDITEQKKLEENLMMTDRLATIGELAAGVAHELNNPLTSVIGFSQLLMEGEVPSEIKDDLKIINSESQRAAKIVKNLLTFGRKHQPVKLLNQINDCINEVLSLRAYEHKCRNIKVINQLDVNLPRLMFDYFQMQQVFINLITNAEFFMIQAHNGGTLNVKTEMSEGTIRASISDDGPGITKENLKHLFDPFFTTKEIGKGTGLGLAICHGIVSEHGGKIYAESEPEKGATFVVELPAGIIN